MAQDLIAAGFLPFSISLLLMLLIGIVEAIGLMLGGGVFHFVEGLLPDLHGDLDAAGGLDKALGWLHLGRLPVLVVLVVFLTSFGLIGLLLQGSLRALAGAPLPSLLAVPGVLLASLPVTRTLCGGLIRIWPGDESSAVSPDSFIGAIAVITLGEAKSGSAAQARLVDAHGQAHYLMVEPEPATDVLRQGESVLIVRRSGASGFIAIRNPNPLLVD